MKSYITFLLISSIISILLTFTYATPIEPDAVARSPNSNPGRMLLSTSLITRDVVMSEETKIKCETSGGSPTVDDANRVSDTLIGWGDDWCRQTNCFGSKCHDIAKEGTAAATICASCLVMIKCKYAGNSISNIVEECKSYVNGAWRAGGQAIYSQGKVGLYHT